MSDKSLALKILTKKTISISRNLIIKDIKSLYKDILIYDSKDINYFKNIYKRVVIINKYNTLTNTGQTIARITTEDGQVVEKTSDAISQMIGPEQYEILFSALCSVLNQEVRIKSIFSILTSPTASNPQTGRKNCIKNLVHTSIQTDETRIKSTQVKRHRIRRKLTPYVVHDFKPPQNVKKVIVYPENVDKITIDPLKLEKTETEKSKSELPDLGPSVHLHDENSNDSTFTFASCLTSTTLMNDPLRLLKDSEKLIEQRTQNSSFNSKLQVKPEDPFHIATGEILKYLNVADQIKLIKYQMEVDKKLCLTPIDEDGNLPIHMAVLNNDLGLLNRQCVVLNALNKSVDVTANGLTPLKLSLFQDSASSTAMLLQHGADVFNDEEHPTYFHVAAELKTDHLSVLLEHTKKNARNILFENEELRPKRFEDMSDDELASHLMDHVCSSCDDRGYTPLMLASSMGHYENVRLLLEVSPHFVDKQMPNTGNTALYLAVSAACCNSEGRINKSKVVDHFKLTIEILLEYNADPTINNFAGSNVGDLLTEYNSPEMSSLVSNKVAFMKCGADPNNLIIFKGNNGEINLMDSRKKTKNAVLEHEVSSSSEESSKSIDSQSIRGRNNPNKSFDSKASIKIIDIKSNLSNYFNNKVMDSKSIKNNDTNQLIIDTGIVKLDTPIKLPLVKTDAKSIKKPIILKTNKNKMPLKILDGKTLSQKNNSTSLLKKSISQSSNLVSKPNSSVIQSSHSISLNNSANQSINSVNQSNSSMNQSNISLNISNSSVIKSNSSASLSSNLTSHSNNSLLSVKLLPVKRKSDSKSILDSKIVKK